MPPLDTSKGSVTVYIKGRSIHEEVLLVSRGTGKMLVEAYKSP